MCVSTRNNWQKIQRNPKLCTNSSMQYILHVYKKN